MPLTLLVLWSRATAVERLPVSCSAAAGGGQGAIAAAAAHYSLMPAVFHFLPGGEFDRLSPEQQIAASRSLAVFARVEPLHKLRLVELLRSQVGHLHAAVYGHWWDVL